MRGSLGGEREKPREEELAEWEGGREGKRGTGAGGRGVCSNGEGETGRELRGRVRQGGKDG